MALISRQKDPIGLHDNPLAQTGAVRPTAPGSASAKPEAAHKNPIAAYWKKSSMREHLLIVVLVVIVVVGSGAYFGVLPALETIASLEQEIDDLALQKTDLMSEIARADSYRQNLAAAEREYRGYSAFFYQPMDPEEIDRMITGMIVDCGMVPLQLDIGVSTPESLAMYQPSSLVPAMPGEAVAADGAAADGTAGADGAGTAGADGAGAGADGAGGAGSAGRPAADAPTGLDAAVSGPQGATGSSSAAGASSTNSSNATAISVYSCTLSIQVESDRDKLFAFLDKVRALPAMEVISYSLPDPPARSFLNSGDDAPPTVSIQAKIYILPGQAG
ncbi:MAG: hypothetical protein LBP28_09015 [Coriobacteriales bacterium]|jgi:hypothetical protein|nr:hypothetical protein [Coriobacteriales bacterium]